MAARTRTYMTLLCVLVAGGCIGGVAWSIRYQANLTVTLSASPGSRSTSKPDDYSNYSQTDCCSCESRARVAVSQVLQSTRHQVIPTVLPSTSFRSTRPTTEADVFTKHFNCSSCESRARPGVSEHQINALNAFQVNVLPTAARDFTQKRYMLAFHYAEQLTMASMSFQAFLNLVFGMNMTGVEPLIHNSRIYSVRDPNSTSENWIPYHTVFNASAIKRGLKKCLLNKTNISESLTGYRKVFESSQAFFKFSYRRIILVHVVADKVLVPHASFGAPLNVWKSRNRNIMKAHPELGISTTIVDCTREARLNDIATHAEDLLNLEQKIRLSCGTQCHEFTVIQSFCIAESTSILLTPNILKSALLRLQYTPKTSIVFWQWDGGRTPKSLQHPVTHFEALHQCRVFPLPHSAQVKDTAAKMLLANKLHDKEFVSVHIRLERLFEFDGFSNRTVCCMERLKKLITLVKNRHHLTHALVITDYTNNDGSDSCRYGGKNEKHQVCEKAGLKALSRLIDVNHSVVQANTTEYGALHHSGFVSRVEAESLLAGQVLITVGTGSFQNSLKTSFLQKWNQSATFPLHYHLCLGVEITNGLEEQLEDAIC